MVSTSETYDALQRRIDSAIDPDNLRLTVTEAAEYIPMQRGQLAQLRYTGKGPRFFKPTPRTVLYRKKDIDDWLAASVCTSTADDVKVAA